MDSPFSQCHNANEHRDSEKSPLPTSSYSSPHSPHMPTPLQPYPPFLLMFRIRPPICSTSLYLIVQNDTFTFYGEPIILSYTARWLCKPTCPDQLGGMWWWSWWWWWYSAREKEREHAVERGVKKKPLIVLSLTSPPGCQNSWKARS